MKKNDLLSDEVWAFRPFEPGTGAAALSSDGVHETLFRDDGDPYPLALDAASVASLDVYAAKPVASIATLADYLVNGFWQYNSTAAHHWTSNTITFNITGLNSAEQFLALSALQAWSDVANVSFVQTSGAANITFTHNGTMQAYTSGNWSGGAIFSQTVNVSSDWITNDGGAYDGKTGIDSYGYQTYIHEIGHALGLGHQGPYNGSASYSTNALYANDTWQYSIMSYFSEPNYSGSSYRYVVTPQMADIYAVASIYGAATSTRTGDTVYGFNSNSGAVFNFGNYSSAPALTIYDSGGNDTLDCSGYSSAQVIDLRPGAFSSIGGLVNNIGIALSTSIEKAIGGSGNDTLIASSANSTLSGGGGNDTLIGGAGNDRLVGGGGIDNLTGGASGDAFVFLRGDSSASSGQHDRITDFTSGLDYIDLSGIDAITGTADYDLFRFIGIAGFDGAAGALDYFYNSSLNVTVLQGDTNGDSIADFAIDLVGNIALSINDLIGVVTPPITIEASGATSLIQIGRTYFMNPVAGTSGPQLKFGGIPVAAGQFGSSWTILGAEAVTGGYDVAWKNTATGLYNIWSTDSSGNYVTDLLTGAAPNSGSLESFETILHQDLNGDGTIGLVGTTIEAFGATSLVQVGANYFLEPVGSNSGPQLKFGGPAVAAGQFGSSWTILGAEAVTGGYDVAWKNTATGLYNIWSTDSSGNYVTDLLTGAAPNSGSLESFETILHQDLNGDGTIGLVGTTIEAFGATSLVQVGANYFLEPVGSNSGPQLKFGGPAVAAGQFGSSWTILGAEAVTGGYDVAWKNTATGLYNIWSTDSSGNYVTDLLTGAAPNSGSLESFETILHQDLNGDGTIGLVGTTIEAFGATSLVQVGANYFLEPVGSNSGPQLKFGGIPVAAGQFGSSWTILGAEAVTGGYDVAWKNTATGLYNIWSTDSSGNYVTDLLTGAAPNSGSLESFETILHQDLNGDGTIGLVGTTIEAFGATSLVQVGANYFLEPVGSNSGPQLKFGGPAVAAGQFGSSWTILGAEAVTGGYDVAWKNTATGLYNIWSTDSSGNYVTDLLTGAAPNSGSLESFETILHQDLNGDGTIGIPSAASLATASLGQTTFDGATLTLEEPFADAASDSITLQQVMTAQLLAHQNDFHFV